MSLKVYCFKAYLSHLESYVTGKLYFVLTEMELKLSLLNYKLHQELFTEVCVVKEFYSSDGQFNLPVNYDTIAMIAYFSPRQSLPR